MTDKDLNYFRRCFDLGLIKTPFLEIGSAKVQGKEMPNLCEMSREYGVKRVVGVDLEDGLGVDFTADFSALPEVFKSAWSQGKFSTVAIFNVLEHTFDPITVLKNALSCVAEGGTLIALTPTVWPIHNFPCDYNRLLPDWYEEFAKINKVSLCKDAFCWITLQFGICRVSELKESNTYVFPSYHNMGMTVSPLKFWTSRIVHRLFNTFGRSHAFTHTALGAAFCC